MGEGVIERNVESGVPVPYLPTLRWYSLYLRQRLSGGAEAEARREANASSGVTGKGFTRCNAGEGIMLKVPVEGGASAVKKLPAARLIISGHGDWRHTHTGTIEALYGRTPFFRHFMAGLEEAYSRSGSPGDRLVCLTESIHNHISGFLDLEAASEAWLNIDAGHRETVIATGMALSRLLSQEESILPAVMRLGPDAIFPLLASLGS